MNLISILFLISQLHVGGCPTADTVLKKVQNGMITELSGIILRIPVIMIPVIIVP